MNPRTPVGGPFSTTLRELGRCLRGDERVVPAIGALSLWSIVFGAAFRHLL
jgi:hypothetical protein